jgi:hypothetical protein
VHLIGVVVFVSIVAASVIISTVISATVATLFTAVMAVVLATVVAIVVIVVVTTAMSTVVAVVITIGHVPAAGPAVTLLVSIPSRTAMILFGPALLLTLNVGGRGGTTCYHNTLGGEHGDGRDEGEVELHGYNAESQRSM